MRDLAVGIAKNTAIAGAQGMLIGAGFELARQALSGEEIDGAQLVASSLKTGADFGLKTAVSGGLKVASEKGYLSVIPKGTPAAVFTDIAFVAIESVKILSQVATGELTLLEAFERIEQVSISSVVGLTTMAKGAAVGVAAIAKVVAVLGLALNPIGATVSSIIGGAIGYMAGSSVAEACVKGLHSVQKFIVETLIEGAGAVIGGICNAIGSAISSLFSWW